jgi:hypothetical protein
LRIEKKEEEDASPPPVRRALTPSIGLGATKASSAMSMVNTSLPPPAQPARGRISPVVSPLGRYPQTRRLVPEPFAVSFGGAVPPAVSARVPFKRPGSDKPEEQEEGKEERSLICVVRSLIKNEPAPHPAPRRRAGLVLLASSSSSPPPAVCQTQPNLRARVE